MTNRLHNISIALLDINTIFVKTINHVNHRREHKPDDMTKIENEMQYASAMKRIDELLAVVNDDTPADDVRSVELVLLSNLVADYEDEHYPIKRPPHPARAGRR